jgi:hypothetical protein
MQDEAPRERLRRSEAAAYARRRLGQSVKISTLRSWPIPYRQIGRDAVYEISDLDRFIEATGDEFVRLTNVHHRPGVGSDRLSNSPKPTMSESEPSPKRENMFQDINPPRSCCVELVARTDGGLILCPQRRSQDGSLLACGLFTPQFSQICNLRVVARLTRQYPRGSKFDREQ